MDNSTYLDIPWEQVKATLNTKLANDRAKLENSSATLEEIRVAQGRISLAKELLGLSKARPAADRVLTPDF